MMMKNKIYDSFEAIDTDLKILKLEKDIHSLKLSRQLSVCKEEMTVNNLLSGTWFSIFSPKKRWLSLVIEYALFFLLRKK
ncbi:DUF6327 family protein [Capnocytophaga leadbetteri]|jgi:hypothetical protein|uniref:DUF6327 family protein n=1 Tax=Capnocytophaga leadbetteri TaxID=327575 RepID=UPI0028EECC76|nr:DUF6327 family protein [Capnocytophaga leadbetteri]